MPSDTTAIWLLMDSRAALEDPPPGGRPDEPAETASIMLSGTCKEVCDAANAGEYGKGCVVVGPDGLIAFHLFATGRWAPDAE